METKSYTIIYNEQIGFGRGNTVTKYKHVVTDNIAQEIKAMEWSADVQFVFDGICIESK